MTDVDPTIFREYDIRGLVDEQLTEDAVEKIGRAYAAFTRDRGVTKIAVGRDCREHSPRLAQRLIAGLNVGGVDVVDIGTCTSPILYFALHHLDVGGGIMLTGSHNPPEYNGLKISIGKRSVHGPEVQAFREIIERGDWGDPGRTGTAVAGDVAHAYMDWCVENIHLGPRKLKVVADAGNGTAGPFVVPILERLGVEVVPLYCEMDSTFPNHHPDPTVEANLEDLKKAVREGAADVGIAFDGDADRLGAVDEEGRVLWGDQMMILFSRAVLEEEPGATIVGEVKCSKTLYDDIEARGGRGIMWRTGHSLIKDKMKETGAALAGEMSGHIFFQHRFFGFDDGIYSALRLLEILSKADGPLSSLLADVPKTYTTPELRVDCPEALKFRLVAAVTEHFKKTHEVIDVDGARVLFEDGWGLVRSSNTQPILVLRFEAETEARLDEIRAYVEGELEKVRKTLE